MNPSMKHTPIRGIAIAALLVLPGAGYCQDQSITNRLTFSARFGFNISAKFKSYTPPAPVRLTPDGTRYNYDDGYMLTDQSGNFGGQTWNWGYDNSVGQISGNTILLSRSTPVGNAGDGSLNADPSFGGELTYNRMLWAKGDFRFGIEAAVNYLSVGVSETATYTPTVNRMTDAYPFTPGTTPPSATPASPYQGSYNGPGFTIGDSPVSSTTVLVPGTLVSDTRRFDSDIWGFRLGPYVEMPLGEKFNVAVSGGLAVGILDNTISWSQTSGGTTSSATTHESSTMVGAYIGANVRWLFSEHWSAAAGVQWQDIGTYHANAAGRQAELDLSSSVFVLFGVSYSW